MSLVAGINTAVRRVPVWLLYSVGVLPSGWWFWQGVNGGLGPEPIKAFEHLLGTLAIQLLIVGLMVTPLRRFFGLNLLRLRRAIGLLAFYYISVHLLVWLLLDVREPAVIWADILKRPYITIGMAAFVLALPLALTSNNASVRRLGVMWRRLHRLVYPVAILAGVHFVMIRKTWESEPLLYLAVILGLLMLRLPIFARATRP